jgi:hypothetical protein
MGHKEHNKRVLRGFNKYVLVRRVGETIHVLAAAAKNIKIVMAVK